MPRVFPFQAIQFAARPDVSALIAPPYDVLDTVPKARLLARDPRNIVAIDLPHTPAKELGPPGAYAAAADRLSASLADGTLTRTPGPVMFAYRQTWQQRSPGRPDRALSRSGLVCCVEAVPFGPRPGGGILPHEETFSGPKEDRLALTHATRTQLSPIFGLHADQRALARDLLASIMSARAPDQTATTDGGVSHERWTIDDASRLDAARRALESEDIFVADGHHRYTTALNYLHDLEVAGDLPPDHPARRTMFVLIGMSDSGLTIWPTHRVLAGMTGYTFDAFLNAAASAITITRRALTLDHIEPALAAGAEGDFGLWDCATGAACIARPAHPDPLHDRFPDKPRAWRDLTVAFCQHVLVESICEGALNRGKPVRWAFPHTIEEVRAIASGAQTGASTFGAPPQLAIILRPTPLAAVRDVSRAGALMPQKSTFFYPKLASGMFMHPLSY